MKVKIIVEKKYVNNLDRVARTFWAASNNGYDGISDPSWIDYDVIDSYMGTFLRTLYLYAKSQGYEFKIEFPIYEDE